MTLSSNIQSTNNQLAAVQTQRTRKPLYFMLLAFLVPAIMAAIALKSGWYVAMGTSNHGALITPPISLQAIPVNYPQPVSDADKTKWKLLYIMPSQCEQACENSLHLMQQIELAIGPEKMRLVPMIITPVSQTAENNTARHNAAPIQAPTLALSATAPLEAIDLAFASFSATPSPSQAGHIYLADPLGNIFMYYPAILDRNVSILKGRDVIKDLKHAMKLSRIG